MSPLPWVDMGPDPSPGVAPSWIDSLEPIDRVGHWPLDEASGNALDVSGNAQSLSTLGGVTRRQAGPVPGMFSTAFNGTSGYFSGPAVAALYGAQQWTIMAWVYLTGTPSLRSNVVYVSGARGGVYGPYLLMGGGDGAPVGLKRPVVGVYTTGGTFYVTSDPNELALNTWYHLAGSYDGISVRYYRDGQHLGESACINAGSSAANIYIARGVEMYPNGYLPGRVADVRYYNFKLSGDQIEQYVARTIGAPVGGRWWPPPWIPLGKVT